MLVEKTCTRCSQTKPLAEFNKAKGYRDGYRSWCRECSKAYARVKNAEYYAADPEAAQRRAGEYYHANRDAVLERQRAWQADHREYFQDYHRANKARQNAQVMAAAKERYATDPEFRAAQVANVRQWRRKNPDKHQAHNAKRRALKLESGGVVTAAEWAALKAKYGHRCLSCSRQLDRLTMDHVVPLSEGGLHAIDNIQPLCRSCNSRKGTRTIDYRAYYPSH
jgi:5-methylcytosine-specific restriction endonuclease McrA